MYIYVSMPASPAPSRAAVAHWVGCPLLAPVAGRAYRAVRPDWHIFAAAPSRAPFAGAHPPVAPRDVAAQQSPPARRENEMWTAKESSVRSVHMCPVAA